MLRTTELHKRYGRTGALIDCNLDLPAGWVVGLVGPNGAGKSTLLGLTCGLLKPSSGRIEVLGEEPANNARQLARVGFVAQDTPVYARLTIADHLRMGARLNSGWDGALAQAWIRELGLDPDQRAGTLSGGQRAQLALAVAAAKRPELLVFDEPVAALDPLARRSFLQNLMGRVAELGVSVILSSHLLSDLERVCDYIVVLIAGRVHVAGDVEDLLVQHVRVTGAGDGMDVLPDHIEVIHSDGSGRQRSLIVRCSGPVPRAFGVVEPIDLEDLILAYMTRAAHAEVVR
jgi:ABC-2 type transport system ATP-binding protein